MGAMKAIFTEAQELREAAAKAADDADFERIAREQGWISPTEFAAMQSKTTELIVRTGVIAFLSDPKHEQESTAAYGALASGLGDILDPEGVGSFKLRLGIKLREAVQELAARMGMEEPVRV